MQGPKFIGSPVGARTLKPKAQYKPNVSLMHQDGGNSGSNDYPGPLGKNISASSITTQLPVLLWDAKNRLTSAYAAFSNGSSMPTFNLAAVDLDSLEVQAVWMPPEANQTLNFAYMELTLEENLILVTSEIGFVYLIQRDDSSGKPIFTLKRFIDTISESALKEGDTLLNGMLDTIGNIWFTTGSISSTSAPGQNSATIGYISPTGQIHTITIANQTVENGIAINENIVYVVTGPSSTFDHTKATGYIYALTAASSYACHSTPNSTNASSIITLWSASYPAGSSLKPGGFARGSGTTPTLLSSQYVAIADNAGPLVSLRIYHQQAQAFPNKQLLCTVPLFRPNASATDNAALSHFNGENYAVVIQNTYNTPPRFLGGGDVNGGFNNMTDMPGGIVRVDVFPENGTCEVRWETPIRIKSVAVLSTATGLVYGWAQDEELAVEGEYVWYAVAMDWDSGEVVWRERVGAGGTFNDNFLPGSLGPRGEFYQGVVGGVVVVKDSEGKGDN